MSTGATNRANPIRKPKILIVDDVPGNIRVLAGILASDYDILVAVNGQCALEVVAANEVDLILLDVIMPEMCGYEVCQYLKSDPQTQEIPIIFLTSKDDILDEAKGLMLGAVDYLLKPIDPKIIKIRIRLHLGYIEKIRSLIEMESRLKTEIDTLASINRQLSERLANQ